MSGVKERWEGFDPLYKNQRTRRLKALMLETLKKPWPEKGGTPQVCTKTVLELVEDVKATRFDSVYGAVDYLGWKGYSAELDIPPELIQPDATAKWGELPIDTAERYVGRIKTLMFKALTHPTPSTDDRMPLVYKKAVIELSQRIDATNFDSVFEAIDYMKWWGPPADIDKLVAKLVQPVNPPGPFCPTVSR